MTMFSRDMSGVPSLTPVNMKILLRGRGECVEIKDIPVVVQVSTLNKGRKGGLANAGESLDESPESNIVAVKSTPSRKKIPKRIRIPAKSMCTKTKLSDKKDDSNQNLRVPPGKKSKLSCKANMFKKSSSISSEIVDDEHKENNRDFESATFSPNNNKIPTENNVKQKHEGFSTDEAVELSDNVREEHVTTHGEIHDSIFCKSSGVLMQQDIQADVSGPILQLRQSKVQDVESSEKVVKESPNKIDSVGDVCLPPGYGSDKLAILLIKLLEEKVKVSSSHSERELFRMTMHVLQCRGCKDREKHNKVRCRRCEERDRKKNVMKAPQEKDQGRKAGQDVCDVLKKPTSKHVDNEDRSVDTEKKLMAKRIISNTGAEESVDNTVILETPEKDSSDKNNMAFELDISCKTCQEKFIHQDELTVHSLRCLKLHVGSKIVSTPVKVQPQPYLETVEHEDLGKIDRDKIFEDTDDETDGQVANGSSHAEASNAPEDGKAPNP